MIWRNDLNGERLDLAMLESLGQSVLNGKNNVSCDWTPRSGKNPAVPKPQTASVFRRDFIARVRWARIGRGYTQGQAAELLSMEQDKYKQYESRSLLPHELVSRFCLLCAVDETWLFTGKGRGPVIAEPPRQEPRQRPPRRKRAA